MQLTAFALQQNNFAAVETILDKYAGKEPPNNECAFEMRHMLSLLENYKRSTREIKLPYIPSQMVPIPHHNWIAMSHGSVPTVTLWDLEKEEEIARFGDGASKLWGNRDGFYYEVGLAVSPDGQCLAYADESGKQLVLADLPGAKNSRQKTIAKSANRIVAADFSPDSSKLAFMDCQARVQIVHVASGQVQEQFRVGEAFDRTSGAPSTVGRLLFHLTVGFWLPQQGALSKCGQSPRRRLCTNMRQVRSDR